MSSGNYLVDMYDREQEREERQSKKLPCGCKKPYCKCDDELENEEKEK